MRRCWLGQLGTLSVLLGFLFATTTPGLALVNAAGRSLAVDGVLNAYICHAQGGGAAATPGETSSTSEECCLVCQAAQLANGAVPPQHFTLPTESAAPDRLPADAHSLRDGEASRHTQARAPPAA
ncbi:MAG: hypothetical protein ACM3Q1_11735 [Bacteroidales bacterium]